MKKLIPGGKNKTRPSAGYYRNELGAPLGYEVMYRKKKGGPMIKHTLQMKKGKNGRVPYWKPAEGKHSLKRSNRRRSTRRRSTRRRSTRRRSTRRRSSRRRSSRRRSTRRRSSRSRSQRGGEDKIARESCAAKVDQYGG